MRSPGRGRNSCAPHVARAVGGDGGADVERPLQVPAGVVLVIAPGAWSPSAAAGHPEVEVVEHQHRDADVAARALNRCAPPMPCRRRHDDDHLEIRARQLDAGGIGDTAAVQTVERRGREVLVRKAGAADVADQHDLLGSTCSETSASVSRSRMTGARSPGRTVRRFVAYVESGVMVMGSLISPPRRARRVDERSGEIRSPSTRWNADHSRAPASRSISRRTGRGSTRRRRRASRLEHARIARSGTARGSAP